MKIPVTTLLLLASVLFACTEASISSPEIAEAESYTIYTEKSELFVEFGPLVVGDTTEFLVHLTVLGETFHALDSAEVSLRLHVGEKGIRNVATSGNNAGIYRTSLSPVAAGEGTLIFEINSAHHTDRIEIGQVRIHPNKESAIAQSLPSKGKVGEVRFLKEQAWKVDFANEPVRKAPFNKVIPCSGELMQAPGESIVVSAEASGIVSFNGNVGIPGAEVRMGQIMLHISGSGHTNANVDRNYQEAKSNLDKAKTDLERAESLAKEQIISQKELRERRNAFEVSEAAFRAISRNYSAEGVGIKATVSGYVQEALVKEGQYVKEGDALMRIAGGKRMQLRAEVSQHFFTLLPKIKSANIRSADGRLFTTEELNGELLAFGRSLNPISSMIPVSFAIDQPEGLPAGTFVEVFLTTGYSDSLISLPISALMEEQGKFYVYVQLSGESFTKREIHTGGRDGLRVEIISGLSEGERVVTRGAYSIKLAQASGSMPSHGHEH